MLVYSSSPDVQQLGARPLCMASSWCFLARDEDGEYITDRVDNGAIDSAVPRFATKWPAAAELSVPIIFDDIHTFREPAEILKAARRWKSIEPFRPIGVYRHLPKRNFWVPVRLTRNRIDWDAREYDHYARLARLWQRQNDELAAALLPQLSLVCPSIYPLTPDEDGSWADYALANLTEARRIAAGRQVIAWLRPTYKQWQQPVSDQLWRQMFEVVDYSGAAAAVFHADGMPVPSNFKDVIARAMRK